MAHITYIGFDGTTTQVEVAIGSTVMQGAIDNGIDGIVADCGGACSCATCHCYVDDAWIERVGEPGSTEKEMLEFTVEPRPNSRLSCQITVTEELDGLVVHLPEAQF